MSKTKILFCGLVNIGMIILNALFVPFPFNVVTAILIGICTGWMFAEYATQR